MFSQAFLEKMEEEAYYAELHDPRIEKNHRMREEMERAIHAWLSDSQLTIEGEISLVQVTKQYYALCFSADGRRYFAFPNETECDKAFEARIRERIELQDIDILSFGTGLSRADITAILSLPSENANPILNRLIPKEAFDLVIRDLKTKYERASLFHGDVEEEFEFNGIWFSFQLRIFRSL